MHSNLLKYFFILIINFYCLKSFSVELNFKFYKAEDGLSSNTVHTALQDSKGFMWFGTENGLNRFDGYKFTVFNNIPRDKNSLINNYVYSLTEDNKEILWVGTERGVSLYDLNKKTFTPLLITTNDGIQVTGRIQNIIYDNGRVWITSATQGVFVCEDNKLTLFPFEEFKIDSTRSIWVNTIYKDKENIIWASVENTEHQIYKFDDKTNEFIPAFPYMNINEQKELRSYSILEDSYGTLWFGTWTNGLIAVNKKEGIIKGRYLNRPGIDRILQIHKITEYDSKTLLIGSNDGLTSFKISPTEGNKLDQHFKEPKLSNRFVYPVYKDVEGGLWIGTYYGGINYASPNRNYFTEYSHIKYENSVTGNVVSCFCEDEKGSLWIGTEDGGLNELDLKTGNFTSYSHLENMNNFSSNNIHALCVIRNELWIGTYSGGLFIMDLDTKKVKHHFYDRKNNNTLDANNIYSIFNDSDDNIWIGTTSGINLYNPESDDFTRMLYLNEFVIDITETENYIWFATINEGLHRYNKKTEEWKQYKYDPSDTTSLISNDVNTLRVDDKKQLWIGTNQGLCRYNPEQDNFIFEEVEFPSNYICKIFSDNDNLWISTLKGLIGYDTSTKEYLQYTQSDGLLSDLFTLNSGLRSSDGRIYLGTPKGFNAFYPRQLVRNEYKPPIEVTEFQLFNKVSNMDDYIVIDKRNQPKLTLAHNNNSFSFEFTTLSYFAPEKNKYSFKLEGFDKEWNDANNNRKATYTNIPPGEYLFRIKASNNDGVWTDNDYILKMSIKPPFWWNVWSIILYILLTISGIIYLFYWLRMKDIRKNEEKFIKIKNEKEKEIYKSQIEFFTNVSHEIRTPLSLIIAPLEQVIENSEKMPDSTKTNLNIMKSNTKRLLTLVNQLLDFSKVEKGGIQITLSNQNIHTLLISVYERFEPLIKQNKIKFEYICDDISMETMTDQENLTKAVSNMLSNALKYTTDYISLVFEADFSDSYYKITVNDNGNGLPEQEEQNIFNPFYQIPGQHKSGTGLGLFLVKSIVEALEGKIDIKNVSGSGVSISLILPKKTDSLLKEKNSKSVLQTRFVHDATVEHIKQQTPCTDSEDEKQTILILEDDADMLLYIRKQLQEDYTVYSAQDGEEGLEILKKQEVDLIIADLMMPKMDGISFCKVVKNNFMWNHIPVIMLTAKTSVVTKVEAFEIGADAYLEKPFNIQYLLTRVKNLLDSRKLLFQKFTQTPYSSLKSIAGNEADEEFLIKLNNAIENNLENSDFSINDLATEMGISSSGLFSKIKKISGVTPNKLIQSMRLKKAAELLSEGKYRVNEVCYIVGFNNPSYFSKCFQKQFGKLPKDFSNNVGELT